MASTLPPKAAELSLSSGAATSAYRAVALEAGWVRVVQGDFLPPDPSHCQTRTLGQPVQEQTVLCHCFLCVNKYLKVMLYHPSLPYVNFRCIDWVTVLV